MYAKKIGLIDIGSNTIRLVIYGIDSYYDITEITNLKTPARLSQYLIDQADGQRMLSEQGISLLTETLASFHHAARVHQVDEMIIFATAAIRQSHNQAEILQRVQEETGLTIQILSEKEEASFGQYAISHSMSTRNMVTIDIGGGSCEVTLVEDKQIVHYHSFPFGVVTLKEAFFKGRRHNDPQAIAATRDYIHKQLKTLPWLKKVKYPIVAVGGSARNIAQVHQRLQRYPIAGIHGYHLSRINLETTLTLFTETPFDQMEDIDGLSSDRIDIIIPANLVFLDLYDWVKAPTLSISNQGLREGIIMHYLNQNFNQPIDPELVRARSVAKVCRDFKVNPTVAAIRAKIAIDLYKQICDLGLTDYDYPTQLEIEFAAYLYQCGQFLGQEADSQHTFYLLSNMNLAGFPHKQRVRLALLSSYRNKSLLYQYADPFIHWFSSSEMDQLKKTGGLIKFAQALNDSQTAPINQLKLTGSKQNYLLKVYHHRPVIAEEYRVDKHLKHLKRCLDGPLNIEFIDCH
ncbi:Ppx/GppA phosphatase family protein [Facklamia languida]